MARVYETENHTSMTLRDFVEHEHRIFNLQPNQTEHTNSLFSNTYI